MTPDTARLLALQCRRIQAATEARDRLIVVARAEGSSLREIAQAAGVSHTEVANIIRRTTTPKETL